jgi:hypothetical protein
MAHCHGHMLLTFCQLHCHGALSWPHAVDILTAASPWRHFCASMNAARPENSRAANYVHWGNPIPILPLLLRCCCTATAVAVTACLAACVAMFALLAVLQHALGIITAALSWRLLILACMWLGVCTQVKLTAAEQQQSGYRL